MTAWNPLVLFGGAFASVFVLCVLLYRQALRDKIAVAIGLTIGAMGVLIGILIGYAYWQSGNVGGIIASHPLRQEVVDPLAAPIFAAIFAVFAGFVAAFIQRLIAEGLNLKRAELVPTGPILGSAVGYIITPSLSGVILCGIAAMIVWAIVWVVPFGVNDPTELSDWTVGS